VWRQRNVLWHDNIIHLSWKVNVVSIAITRQLQDITHDLRPRLVSRSYGVVRIGPTTGLLTRSPDSLSLLRTVWPKIRAFARPGVLHAASSVVIIRVRRWIRRKCLSWRCDVTRGLPLREMSFVLSVWRWRVISLKMVILDTLRWSATAWWVIPAWTIPTTRSQSFWRALSLTNSNFQNGKLLTFVDSTINYCRWFKCLIRSSQTRSWDGKLTFRNFSDIPPTHVKLNSSTSTSILLICSAICITQILLWKRQPLCTG